MVPVKGATMPEFGYEDLLPLGADDTAYRLVTAEGVRTVAGPDGREFLEVAPEALRLLTETAMHDIAHYLRTAHLAQVRSIIDDPEASSNDKFVALDLLKNANIAAGGVLAHRQDTTGRDVRVLEQVECDELVVAAGLGVVDDAPYLCQVRGSQVVRDVMHGRLGQQPE